MTPWLVIAPGIVAMAAVFWGLGKIMAPLPAYLAALAVYWVGLALLVRDAPGVSLRPRWPGLAVALLLAAFVGWLWWRAGHLGAALPPAWAAGLVLAALVNGTLEEAFWRGALIPGGGWLPALWANGWFTLWHVALLAAPGIVFPGGGWEMVAGAGIIGLLLTFARLTSGTAGTPALAHVAINIPAFWALAAANGAA